MMLGQQYAQILNNQGLLKHEKGTEEKLQEFFASVFPMENVGHVSVPEPAVLEGHLKSKTDMTKIEFSDQYTN